MVFHCILGSGPSVEIKRNTCKEPRTHRSQETGERKKLVSIRKVHLPHFFYPQGKIWGCSPAYPSPSFQAPFDEAGAGQEHQWLQGSGKTSVFMVAVLSIWVKPSNGGVCTWVLNAPSVLSHFLWVTDRKTPQPKS